MKKRFIVGLTLALMPMIAVWAVERSGRANENVIINTGDRMLFFKVSVPASGVAGVIVSSYSVTKSRLLCQNIGVTQAYLGAQSDLVLNSTNTYAVQPSTAGSSSIFETGNSAAIYAVGGTGGTTLNCIEER